MEKWSFDKIELEQHPNQFLEEPFIIWTLYGMQVGSRGNYVFYLKLNRDTDEVSLDSVIFYKAKRDQSPTEDDYYSIESLLTNIQDKRLEIIQSAEVKFIGIPNEQLTDTTIQTLLKFLHDEFNDYYSPPLYRLK